MWVSEFLYHLWQAGAIARAEFGGRSDVVLDEEFFEVKSSRTSYALRKSSKDEIDAWFAKDIEKLRKRQAAGHFIITICTIAGSWLLPFSPPDGRADLSHDWAADRARAIRIYQEYAAHYSVNGIRHVNLGQGELPSRRGTVQLDVLIFSVHASAQQMRMAPAAHAEKGIA